MQTEPVRVVVIGFDHETDSSVWRELREAAPCISDAIFSDNVAHGIEQIGALQANIVLLRLQANEDAAAADIRRLRAASAETPIIAITDSKRADAGFQAIANGAQEYLREESLTPDLICRTIRIALARAKAARELHTTVEELAMSQAIHTETIEELEASNAELLELNEKASQASVAKGEFLAHMSHEIRTPLTAILGYADVLLDQLRDPDSIEAVETIRRNGVHLLDVMSDILDLSRIESGRMELEILPLSPVDVVEDVIGLMRVRADSKGLDLRCEYLGPIPATLSTDPTRVRQVLVNLVGNAIKFTEIGGVQILTRFDIANSGDPQLVFDVVDTGIGISAERLEQVFQPFSQADDSMSRRFGGAGLGLAIASRLTEMLGGTLGVKSAQGEGSTFSLSLPVPLDVPANQKKEIEPRKPVQVSTERTVETTPPRLACHILLAEDGPDNQRLASLILRKAGANVVVAENGRRAYEMAMAACGKFRKRYDDRDTPFDVVLMDMQMPIMDGYEATRLLRQEGFDKPIIALTAHAMSHDRQKCLDAGCDDYISKPIDRKQFLDTIARYTTPQRTLPPMTSFDLEGAADSDLACQSGAAS